MQLTDKSALRASLRHRLAKRDPSFAAAASLTLCDHIRQLPAYENCRWLLAFSPLSDEPDIIPLLQTALADGHRVALPVCDPMTHTLRFYEITSLTERERGHYGIAEPPTSPDRLWQPTADVLCLVPALGYDRLGHRLGRGGGYYDRFLPYFTGVSCGVCLSDQLCDRIPVTPTDFSLSLVVTEGGICCA